MHKSFALALALALVASACTEENPTDVGDALIPSGDVLTFEVILPASAFLLNDTSFAGFNTPADAPFTLIAKSFENVVDANTLLRFATPQRSFQVRSGTSFVVDSAITYTGGRLLVRLDSVQSTARPVKFALYRIAEPWDVSATWQNRVDTVGNKLPWTTPGGTRGELIDTATWVAGDSLAFRVDSTTIALWRDTANHTRGAILVSETAGSRARMVSTSVRVNARSAIQPDTALVADVSPIIRTYVTNPTLAPQFGGIRVGGIPTWRSILSFREDLGTMVIPCGNGQAGCSVRLDSVHINRAQILLRPAITPAGFVPEDSIYIEARPIVLGPGIPLERSPIGNFASGVRTDLLAPTLFRAPTATDVVRLDVTNFLVHQFDESITEGNRLPFVLALLQLLETNTAGFATFQESPMLRLILTTTTAGR
jgi:hypothetical protein